MKRQASPRPWRGEGTPPGAITSRRAMCDPTRPVMEAGNGASIMAKTANSTSDLTMGYIERRAKFKRRAEGRLNGALNQIKQLSRCANRTRYAYDQEQIDTIVRQLRNAVDDLERAFTEAGGEGRKWIEL